MQGLACPGMAQTSDAHPASSAVDAAYQAALAAKSTQGDLGRPYVLPQASRARMHECGVEWQRMKMSGEATDKIWRVFASVCLARAGDKPAAPADPQKER
jgi:hypothetical protein